MLEAIITSKTKRDLFALLFLNPEKEYYLREISREITQNPSLISSELKKLESKGIVRCRRKGNVTYYSANKETPIYAELKSIMKKGYALAGVLKRMLSRHSSVIDFAFVYGSYAREEERAGSDIDLMIIGDPPLKQFNAKVTQSERILGREINYSIFPSEEFIKKSKTGFIEHILKEKKIMLLGDEYELKRLATG